MSIRDTVGADWHASQGDSVHTPAETGGTVGAQQWTAKDAGFSFHPMCSIVDARGNRVVDGFVTVERARLIAAAPELLAFVRRYTEESEASGGWPGDEALFSTAMALLAKVSK